MIPTMDDFDFKNKSVILRVDINSPLNPSTLEIMDNWRIKRCIPTIEELREKNAKIIILAFFSLNSSIVGMHLFIRQLSIISSVEGFNGELISTLKITLLFLKSKSSIVGIMIGIIPAIK